MRGDVGVDECTIERQCEDAFLVADEVLRLILVRRKLLANGPAPR